MGINNMYILEPVCHRTIWGGKKLSKYTESNVTDLGHLYMVNGHRGMSNRIKNGLYSGKTLYDIFDDNKKDWRMKNFEEFPLTIALVDACEDLSIQVHPDDLIAESLENRKIGKTESWIFLEAPKVGWIYNGCKCSEKKDIENAVLQGKVEDIINRVPINVSDYVCIESGTLHAMTAGSVVYEIEYGSDFTYRFFDYGRRDEDGNLRELHINKAIEAMKPKMFSKVKHNIKSGWISEKNYEVCRITKLKEYKNQGNELECVSLIKGQGRCDGCKVISGMSIILLPGEKIEHMDLDEIIIARLRR